MRLALIAGFFSTLPLFAQLQLIQGHGQLVAEQFPSAPLVVRAVDATGRPQAGITVNWAVTSGQGSIVRGTGDQTDGDGFAAVRFIATSLQPGTSWSQATVTASSSVGVVPFIITTYEARTGSGQPTMQFLGLGELRGEAGSTIREAFVVQVVATSGISAGSGIPNVGVRLVLPEGVDPATAPFGTCEGAQSGVLLTDARGFATCNLVLNRNVGRGSFNALIGEILRARNVGLEILPGAPCTVTLTPASQNFPANGGVGTVQVAANAGCSWTATSNASWITVSNVGATSFSFGVSANTGTARSGTITVANQTFTVTQTAAGASGGPLAFSVGPNLPGGTVGSAYSFTVGVSGGTPPYTWSTTGTLPAGLALNAGTGQISGVPSAPASVTLPIAVRDATGAQITQTFSLAIQGGASPGGPIVITTTSFPNGSVGVPYSAPLSVTGGCQNPFAGGPTVTLVSGSVPPGLTLQSASGGALVSGTPTRAGAYPFSVRVSDSCGASTTRDFSITIGEAPSAGGLTASPTSVGFTVAFGTTQTFEQTVRIETGGTPTNFTVLPSTAQGDWLSVTPASGVTPRDISVRVSNYANLQPGVYTGQISILSQATPAPVVIPVTLTIGGTTSSPFTAAPPAVAFNPPAGSTANLEATVAIGHAVTPQSFTAVASGANWISVTPSSGTTPSTLIVRASNYSSLTPGTYSANVAVSSTQGSLNIPVSLTILPGGVSASLAVTPTTVALSPAAGAAEASANVVVSSTGSALPFTVSTSGEPWLSVVPAAGTTPAQITIRAANYGSLAAGTYAARVTLASPGISPVQIPVTLTVPGVAGISVAPTALTFEWQPGAAAPAPQTLNVSGQATRFTATALTRTGGQWLVVTPASGVSPGAVQVSINPGTLAAGTYNGEVTLTPDTTRTPTTIPVTLRVTQATPQIGSVTNGASFQATAVSPGQIVTIFGSGLGPVTLTTLRLTPAGTIDTILSGTRVWFDEQLAPIVHTSSGQVTVVAPYTLAGQQRARVVVEYNGVFSPVREVAVAETAPALFTIGAGNQAALLNQDSTVNTAQNGALPGSVVSLFGTGEGLTTPIQMEGAVAGSTTLARPIREVSVTVGGRAAQVLYAGSAPGLPVGVFQVNVRIPEDVAGGSQPVVVTVGGASSQPNVTLYVAR